MESPFAPFHVAPVEARRHELAPPLGPMIAAVALIAATIALLAPRVRHDDRLREIAWAERFSALAQGFVPRHALTPSHESVIIVGASSVACDIGASLPNLGPDGARPVDLLALYRPRLDWDASPVVARAAALMPDHLVVDEDAILFVVTTKLPSFDDVQNLGLQVRLPGRPFTLDSARQDVSGDFFEDECRTIVMTEHTPLECAQDCAVRPSDRVIEQLVGLADRGVDVVTITMPNRGGEMRISDREGLAARDAMRARLAAAGIPHFDAPLPPDDMFANSEHMNEKGRARTREWLARLLASRVR